MTLSPSVAAEVHRLFHVEKWKVGTIARHLHVHHRSVRRAAGLTLPPQPRPKWNARLAPFEPFIAETLQRYPQLCASRMTDMLKERGYTGSDRSVRRYVKPLRPSKRVLPFLEIETLPGEQAQVDWAHVGRIAVDGGTRPLWLFVMVLSHSRALYAELLMDLSAHGVVRSLIRASNYFGGCPRQWLFDNPKTVVLARYGEETRFNPHLLEVAVALRVQPRLCAVRKPTDKGKVERAVRYLRDRFLGGRTIRTVGEGNAQLHAFLENISQARMHPVQRQRTVGQVFEEDEKKSLLSLPEVMPPGAQLHLCRVDGQANVRFETNRYSVPPEYVDQAVTLRVDDIQVHVDCEKTRIASHPRSYGKHQRVENPEHRQELIRQRRNSRPAKGRDRLLSVAPEVKKLLENMLREGLNVGLGTHRLLQLLDLYGDEVFRRAVADVVQRGSCDVSALAVRCDAHRRALNAPQNLPVTLPPHAVDRDVIPHDLESYDE